MFGRSSILISHFKVIAQKEYDHHKTTPVSDWPIYIK
jgi:hypothetical protein